MTLATRQALQVLSDLGALVDSSLAGIPITTHQAVTTILDLLEDDFLPKPAQSDKHWERAQHADLPALDAQALWRETRRAEFRTVECQDRTGWIAERYAACLAEAKRRTATEKRGKG